MATVITLEPAFFAVWGIGWLKGSLVGPNSGNVHKPCLYPNIPDPFAIGVTIGKNKLDTMLHANIGASGGLIVAGHSEGSQTICAWLRDFGPTSDIDPTKVKFILTGNPERKYGGVIGMVKSPKDGGGLQAIPWLGGVLTPPKSGSAVNVPAGQLPGIPLGNRYTVQDCAFQYDKFADYPTISGPAQNAITNASANVHMGLTGAFSYFKATLSDPTLYSATPENNITYSWWLNPMLPAAASYRGTKSQKQTYSDSIRPDVESNYTRPVTIPYP